MSRQELPSLFTARYFAEGLLTGGDLVPVRINHEPLAVPLPYRVEEAAELLMPTAGMLGDTPNINSAYWRTLERIGFETIAAELAAISTRHGGKPLALVDHEDLLKGHGSHRVVVAAWWEEKTGRPVHELLGTGEHVHYTELPEQVRPVLPASKEADRRWRETEPRPWPLNHEDLAGWIGERYWQTARSRNNPHQYTLRRWGEEGMFERVVLFIREHGYQSKFGLRWYTQYDCGDHFYWTMGAPLAYTTLVNRKKLEGTSETQGAEPELFAAKEDR